jgi:hypothetical protein
MKPSKIVVTLTQTQAEKLGIVRCVCGHRPNNHFSHTHFSLTSACAFCQCVEYRQVVRLPAKS